MTDREQKQKEILCNWRFGKAQGFICVKDKCSYKQECDNTITALAALEKPMSREKIITLLSSQNGEKWGIPYGMNELADALFGNVPAREDSKKIKLLESILKDALSDDKFNDHSSGIWQMNARKALGLPDEDE